jgi:hypothetical protein
MNWKRKSLIQRTCAALPASESIYYFLQRNFGSLRRPPDPMPMMRAAAEIFAESASLGYPVDGRRVMEVGTGRRIEMPLAFYLCGAREVHTFDLHRYLRPELVEASVAAMAAHRAELLDLFSPVSPRADVEARLDRLSAAPNLETILRTANVRYHAPADAAKTGLPDGSIDFQFSYTVFEHIPGPVLSAILTEAGRLLSPTGVACHHIDLSDHFAHEDRSIPMIHFLRYSEDEFRIYNDNQFAYCNRLRKSEYDAVYAGAGQTIVHGVPIVHDESLALLRGGFPLADPYRGTDPEELATLVYRVYSRRSA